VLVLSPTPTHPQDYGNRKRVFQVCDDLTRRGARITFVHYPAEAEWRRRLPAAAPVMAGAWHASYTVPVTRELHMAAAAADHTIDEWWDQAIGDFLSWLFSIANFDVFIVNYAWLSRAFLHALESVFKILDTHDRFSGRRDILGRLGIAAEFFHTTGEQEAIALSRADLVWAIKPEEAQAFAALAPVPMLTLPHIDRLRPLPAPAADPDGYLRVGIVAARNNINRLNLARFLAVAIPLFDRFFAPIELCIAGSICDLLATADARFVTLCGRIGSTEDFYRSIDVACIPIEASTGLKIKTGEAIALGMPTVCLAHGFEGYTPAHPLHVLARFEEMAACLVDLSFDRQGLADMRVAAAASATATSRIAQETLTRSWALVSGKRRVAILCVSAAALNRQSPEHLAFASTLDHLHRQLDVEVLIVTGSAGMLLGACSELETKARLVVAADLPGAAHHAAALAARGFGIEAPADMLNRFAECLVIIDALSDGLLAVTPAGGVAGLRAAIAFQSDTPALAAGPCAVSRRLWPGAGDGATTLRHAGQPDPCGVRRGVSRALLLRDRSGAKAHPRRPARPRCGRAA
jgi:hypothetical protein